MLSNFPAMSTYHSIICTSNTSTCQRTPAALQAPRDSHNDIAVYNLMIL